MGADLLLATLIHDKDKKLDWTKGRQVARKLPIDKVQRGLAECYGEEADSAKEARANLNDLITDLKAELKESGRDEFDLEVGGKYVHIRGGVSFGDDPSPGWTTFTNASYFPQVLRAIGFDVDGDEQESIDDWIEEHGDEVQVAFTCPVEVVVNLRTGTVEQVVAIDEGVVLDEVNGEPNVNTRTGYQGVENADVVRRAVELADGPDVEWPAWQHGW